MSAILLLIALTDLMDILLCVVDGLIATAGELENEKMLCRHQKRSEKKSYYLMVGDSCCIKELNAVSNVHLFFLLGL